MPLTIAEKLDKIAASGWPLAYDGCHKIYFLQDKQRVAQATDGGFEIHPSAEVHALFERSCFLRFVTRWGLNNGDFGHPLNIEQFEDDS